MKTYVEEFIDKGRIKYRLTEKTTEIAIEDYHNKLKAIVTRYETKTLSAKVRLATFECTFQDQLRVLAESGEELEHAKRHKLLYDHFEELAKDWYDHEEHAEQRGTVLDLETWACKQAGGLDHKRN